MEGEERAIWFNDLAEFVDHKASVATNPLFGKIVEDSQPRPDTRRGLLKKGFHKKTKERRSFASHVNDYQISPPISESPSQDSPSVEEVSCLYCKDRHALESCKSCRSRHYVELTDSFVLQDLAISDLDGNVFVKFPLLYTKSGIPVSKEDIPNKVDVDK